MRIIGIIFSFLLLATLPACFIAAEDPLEIEMGVLEKYIEKNYPDAEPQKSGLYYIHQKTGIGNKVQSGDTVTVHYIGKLLNGNEFDNTYKKDTPFEFIVDGRIAVITGFREGIMYMREGDTAILIMPPTLAYEDRRNGEIPPYSSLYFEVEIVNIKGKVEDK